MGWKENENQGDLNLNIYWQWLDVFSISVDEY